MSVNELHKLTGISRTTLTPLSETNTLPSKTRVNTLERICEKLNIEMNELISFDYTSKEMISIPISEYERLKQAEEQLNNIKEILGGEL